MASCVALQPDDLELKAEEKRFTDSWKPGRWQHCDPNLRATRILKIYKVQTPRPDYVAKQEQLKSRPIENGGQIGNEHRYFHGTSLACGASFTGQPCCSSSDCGVCGILRAGGKLLLDFVGKRSPPIFGRGLYLTSCSNTAKGYGGKGRGGSEKTGFHRGDNGNALLVCDVLMGNVERHQRKGSTNPKLDPLNAKPLGEGFDSRLIEKSTGNDELVVFSEEQVQVKYIITFDPDDHGDQGRAPEPTEPKPEKPQAAKLDGTSQPGKSRPADGDGAFAVAVVAGIVVGFAIFVALGLRGK